MPRYAQLVIGPAGSGKSSYCSALKRHCDADGSGRVLHVVNLDPAAENFDYEPLADVRDLIQLDDAMEDPEMRFGPNGGLVFCMEFLVDNLHWLDEQLGDADDDYLVFDCPGQIELYSHLTVMRDIVRHLEACDFRVCAVFLLDARYLCDVGQLISGAMAAMAAMVSLEVSHINLMTKVDLLSRRQRRQMERYLDPDMSQLLGEESQMGGSAKLSRLHAAMAGVVEDYGLLRFCPVAVQSEAPEDEELLVDVLQQVDMALQYGEDQEPRNRDADRADEALIGSAAGGDDD